MIPSLTCLALLSAFTAHIAPAANPPQPPPQLVTDIEQAHKAELWRAQAAIELDIKVEFGGRTMFDGIMTFSTHGGRARMMSNSGAIAVFDGSKAWVANGQTPNARFQILTWPYFACVPYKLRDGGATAAPAGNQPTTPGQPPAPAIKLTFAPGTGDAPDDWYLLMPQIGEPSLLHVMSYIVTYGKAPGTPEDPHAIVYSDFQDLQGIPFARTWTFYNWNRTEGCTGEPLGRATIRNAKFVPNTPGLFEKMPDATEAPLPTPAK